MSHHRPLSARQFHDALVSAGVIRDGEHIRRIVIDASADTGLVTLYLERDGDDRLVDVIPLLTGIEVVHQDPSPRTVAEAESV